MQRLLILRGPMGSGKTSLAKLYRSYDQKWAHLQVDLFKNLFEHFEKPARPVVHRVVVDAVDSLLSQGYSVVMEGVLQDPVTIDWAIEVAKKHQVPYQVIELTADLDTLEKRDQQRPEIQSGQRTELGKDAIAHIADKLERKPHPEAIKIDTTKLTLEEVRAMIDG